MMTGCTRRCVSHGIPPSQITEEKIERFVASYQGSDAEVDDLKKLYTEHKGNMQRFVLLLAE